MRVLIVVLLLAFTSKVWAGDGKSYKHWWFLHDWDRYHDRDRHYDRHDRHDRRYREDRYRRGHWVRVDQFRTRDEHRSDPVVYVNAKVRGISLTGLKRRAIIYGAYAETRKGRLIPLYELEGSLRRGRHATAMFKKPRYIHRIIFRVGPGSYRRGYVGVDYLPAGRGRDRDDYHDDDRDYDHRHYRGKPGKATALN